MIYNVGLLTFLPVDVSLLVEGNRYMIIHTSSSSIPRMVYAVLTEMHDIRLSPWMKWENCTVFLMISSTKREKDIEMNVMYLPYCDPEQQFYTLKKTKMDIQLAMEKRAIHKVLQKVIGDIHFIYY